jgi:quinolinate synthase
LLFVPDRKLADYTARRTNRPLRSSSEYLSAEQLPVTEPGTIIAWDGYCYVHDDLVLQELEQARQRHPNAKVIIHPEARRDLLERADFVVSTSRMASLAEDFDELIIGTERGLIDKLQLMYPQKTIVALSRVAVCGNMKVNTLAKLAWCLDHEQYRLELPEVVRTRAETALRRMLDLSGGWRTPSAEERHLEEAGLQKSGCGCA